MNGWLLAVSSLLLADISAANIPLVPADSTVIKGSTAKPEAASRAEKPEAASRTTKPEAATSSSEARPPDATRSKEPKSTSSAKPSAAKPAAAAHGGAVKQDEPAPPGTT